MKQGIDTVICTITEPDNAALAGVAPTLAMATLLHAVALRVMKGDESGNILDANGNTYARFLATTDNRRSHHQ